MINPVNNKIIKLFLDTNVMEDRIPLLQESSPKCGGFPESKVFCDLIRFVEFYDLNSFRICIPEIVIREKFRHIIETYISSKKIYCDTLDNAKIVFGNTFSEKHEFRFNTKEEITRFVLSDTKRFIKEYKKHIDIIKHPNDLFPNILEKALAHRFPFATAHKGRKEYRDAGFKDAIIWESILQEIKKENVQVLFFSKDNDFSTSLPQQLKDKVILCSEYEAVIKKLTELYDLYERIKLEKIIGTKYFWDRIMDIANIKGNIDVSSVKIVSIEQDNNINESDPRDDSENEEDFASPYSIKANISIDGKLYCFVIMYDYSSNEVMDAEIEQEGE